MFDRFIPEFDRALRAVAGVTRASRPNPADAVIVATSADKADSATKLSEADRRHAAGLMRVNHVGEVCAQALYQGQALFARDPAIRAQLDEAAREEEDHLAWCAQRLQELNDRPSLLNPLWYAGAFAIGAVEPAQQGIDAALKEIDRAIDVLGLAGIDLEPGFAEPARHPDDTLY